jgi:hypothetical protein
MPAGRMPERLFVLPLERALGSCRVAESHPFAGEARSHRQPHPALGEASYSADSASISSRLLAFTAVVIARRGLMISNLGLWLSGGSSPVAI